MKTLIFTLVISTCLGLPTLPLLTDHPPLVYRLGDLSEKIERALKSEVHHSTIRNSKGDSIKCYLNFSKVSIDPKGGKLLKLPELIKTSFEILKHNLPEENLKGAELVDFTRVISQQDGKGVWVFQYIVKDFTPSGGLGFYPTVIVGLNVQGEHLGRFLKEEQSDAQSR